MDRFVWDDAKNAENIALRGFGLDIVYLLDWSAVVFREDTRFDYGESRLVVMGQDRKEAVLRGDRAAGWHDPRSECASHA
jgi:uncharacterized DUF497 family protein